MSDSDPAGRRESPGHDVRIRGADERSLAAVLESPDVSTVDQSVSYDCLSEGRRNADWWGVPVADLVDAVDVPEETTHLVVESRDGYRSCVSVDVALEGLLALERDGASLQHPRFLAPGIEGPRAVKDVAALTPVSLDPEEDRSEYETDGADSTDSE
jgi:DMSO/TMAO reductase YedYZ molybdopterin-dependent catalytic subunit